MLKFTRTYGEADGTLDRNRKHGHPGSEAITVVRQKLKFRVPSESSGLKFRVPSESSGQRCVQHFDRFMTSEVLYTLGWRPLTVYKE